MPVNSENRFFDEQKRDWEMIRDSLKGERVVKDKRSKYLPIPPGLGRPSREFTDTGKNIVNDEYTFYLSFADFPEILSEALNGFQGIVHDKDPVFTLPTRLTYLENDATPDLEPLVVLWQRITREILSLGRVGLLCDIGLDDLVRVVLYPADTITNWRLRPRREGGMPEFVVVREKRWVEDKDEFQVKELDVYRELRINDGVYQVRTWIADRGEPEVELTEDTDAGGWVTPVLFGSTFPEIPLTIVNATELGFRFGPIPLRPLARRVHAAYRLSADYKRALYVKGDPQAVISGVSDEEDLPDKIGGSEIWMLPPGADAKYLDIDGEGIPLMRQAIQDEFERFYQEGGRLLDTTDRGPESGEALRRRQAAQQVTLKSIAITAATGVEEVLRKIALYMRSDPEQTNFMADTDFTEPTMSGEELLKLTTAKNAGAPMSQQTLHDLMKRGRLTDKEFEDELEEMEGEVPQLDGLTGMEEEEKEDGEMEPGLVDLESMERSR